jgi:hypothetical protein
LEQMPGRPVEAISLLAEIVGVSGQTYRNWKAEDLVRGPRADEPTDLDVVEVVALRYLLKELGDANGRVAWDDVRDELLQTIPAQAVRLVWHDRWFKAQLCGTDEDLSNAVATELPIRVLAIGKVVIRPLEGFRHRREVLARSRHGSSSVDSTSDSA